MNGFHSEQFKFFQASKWKSNYLGGCLNNIENRETLFDTPSIRKSNIIIMLKTNCLSFFMLVAIQIVSFGQGQVNWPEDPKLQKKAKEKHALYTTEMKSNRNEQAWASLQWLYKNTPDLHESIYQDGAKIIDSLLDTLPQSDRTKALQDSMLWVFDERMRRYPGDGVLDRKAYALFKMHYKNPKQYPLILEAYEELFAKDPSTISSFNLAPYMTLAKYYNKTDDKAMPENMVLAIHGQISKVIEAQLASGGDMEKLKREQNKIDALLGTIEDLMSCSYVEKLVPDMESGDLESAKKVVVYSAKAGCTDQPYFLKAASMVYDDKPTYKTAILLADLNKSKGNYSEAEKYYSEAKKMASSDEEKYELTMSLASLASQRGQKSKARGLAYDALKIKPGSAGPYNLIGNLYFTSGSQCKGGVSRVKDRAVYIAAYDMYKKAGNNSQMAAAKEQFPSIEEIFNEGMQEGQKVKVKCWIGTTVKLQRR